MGLGAVIWIGISILLLALSFAFKVAGKLRLTIPLFYLLAAVVSTFFTTWAGENEDLVLLGLYILIGLVVLSWIFSLVKKIRNGYQERQYNKAFEDDVTWQIQKARELGISFSQIVIREDGTVLHADTREPIIPMEYYKRSV